MLGKVKSHLTRTKQVTDALSKFVKIKGMRKNIQ